MTESFSRLILASASRTRANLLRAAGLDFEIVAADLDEETIKCLAGDPASDIEAADVALLLAQAKAVAVSQQFPDALVIGADQTLLFKDRLLDKPADSDAARDQLLLLRGQTHTLNTVVACASNGEVLWTTDEQAHLTLRDFSPHALGQYLAAAGADVTSSVGGYRIEGPAIQLFDRIEGDYFTILGLPLLGLLRFLRDRGVLVQ
jgi:nucleoside triphosphate pyrophosphatase